MEDYNFSLKYHPGKANIVADALSHKMVEILAGTIYCERENLMALQVMNLNIDVEEYHLLVAF